MSTGPEKEDNIKPGDANKFKGSIYMVFEYMDHDLTGLSDRPGMRFSIPQIKVHLSSRTTTLLMAFSVATLYIFEML
jgi:cyclin-dependent kinase 12/13